MRNWWKWRGNIFFSSIGDTPIMGVGKLFVYRLLAMNDFYVSYGWKDKRRYFVTCETDIRFRCPQIVLLEHSHRTHSHCTGGQSQSIHLLSGLSRKHFLVPAPDDPWAWDVWLNSAPTCPLKLCNRRVYLNTLFIFLWKGSRYFMEFLKGSMPLSQKVNNHSIWKVSKQTS